MEWSEISFLQVQIVADFPRNAVVLPNLSVLLWPGESVKAFYCFHCGRFKNTDVI